VWGTYDIASLVKPYISLTRLSAVNLGSDGATIREAATEQRITITQTLIGGRVNVGLTWAVVEVLVEAGDSLADTRDKFVLALQASVAETADPLTFAADGAASILVTPVYPWVSGVVAYVGCTVEDTAVAQVKVQAATRLYRVRVQLYGFDGDGLESIDEYADVLAQSLGDNTLAEPGGGEADGGLITLGRFGVGVQGAPPDVIDVSAISGALQERRLFFDVSFVAKSVQYRRSVQILGAVDPPIIVGVFP
jgi:hypothetical protein